MKHTSDSVILKWLMKRFMFDFFFKALLQGGRTWRHHFFLNFSAIQCKFNRWLKTYVYMQWCCSIIVWSRTPENKQKSYWMLCYKNIVSQIYVDNLHVHSSAFGVALICDLMWNSTHVHVHVQALFQDFSCIHQRLATPERV